MNVEVPQHSLTVKAVAHAIHFLSCNYELALVLTRKQAQESQLKLFTSKSDIGRDEGAAAAEHACLLLCGTSSCPSCSIH